MHLLTEESFGRSRHNKAKQVSEGRSGKNGGAADAGKHRDACQTHADIQKKRIQAVLETADGSGLRVRLDGVAFYQGNDLIELWQAWPEATTYQLMPLALQELRDDLATLKELTDSFQFQDSSQSQEESL